MPGSPNWEIGSGVVSAGAGVRASRVTGPPGRVTAQLAGTAKGRAYCEILRYGVSLVQPDPRELEYLLLVGPPAAQVGVGGRQVLRRTPHGARRRETGAAGDGPSRRPSGEFVGGVHVVGAERGVGRWSVATGVMPLLSAAGPGSASPRANPPSVSSISTGSSLISGISARCGLAMSTRSSCCRDGVSPAPHLPLGAAASSSELCETRSQRHLLWSSLVGSTPLSRTTMYGPLTTSNPL